MNTLILDCSCGMNIFLLKENEVLSHIDNNQKKHTDELLLAVNKLLVEAKISIKDIENICVCIGPGSFTGIRVAVSICKGLTIGINAKVFVANNFDIYSYGTNKNSIFILDGFSDYVYVRINEHFDNSKNVDYCERISILTDKIKKDYSDYDIYVQSEKMQNILNNYEISSKFAENQIVKLFNDKIKYNLFINLNEISPVYLRASQAELEREEKLKRDKIDGQ